MRCIALSSPFGGRNRLPVVGTIRIGLLWHLDRSGTLGVGALTVGNIALVRAVEAEVGAIPTLVILGFADRGTPYVADPDVAFEPFARRVVVGFGRAFGRVDAIPDIGAGDSFTDIYPFKRFVWIVLSKVAEIAPGVPLVSSPQTIGPFVGGSAAKRALGQLAFWMMRRARAVVVREDRSHDAVGAAVPGVEPVYSVDVAFALPWTAPPPSSGPPRIGVNVSGLLWRGGYAGRGEFALGYDYNALMTGLIEALLAAGDCTVELVCHVNGDATCPATTAGSPTNWRRAGRRWFVSPTSPRHQPPRVISPGSTRRSRRGCMPESPHSRLEPVVPVSYSRRSEGLFGSLGDTRLVAHTGILTGAALALILSGLHDRDALAADIAAGLTQVEARLGAYRTVLRQSLSRLK